MQTLFRKRVIVISIIILKLTFLKAYSIDFTDHTFLIAHLTHDNIQSSDFWKYLASNNHSGITIDLTQSDNQIKLENSKIDIGFIINKIDNLTDSVKSKVMPVFLNIDGDIRMLDSLIKLSHVSSKIFYLPQGEAWPSIEYLIQAKRGVIFFISGNYTGKSNILHDVKQYVSQISANENSGTFVAKLPTEGLNTEMLLISEFNELPTKAPSGQMGRNMVPEYINFLLENWTRYGKRPNFIFIGESFAAFNFIIAQLKSFIWINGIVKVSGKTMERVYWKSPDISVTGGKFSFPYRGGEEKTFSPFVPGFRLSPSQIIVTGEMEIPENYTINATPLGFSDGIKGGFSFDGSLENIVDKQVAYKGENYSFTEDIERGTVLKLPEKSSINLGDPGKFGMRNSSFTVSCFVKFTDILEYGDNAVLGNYESEYRRGLHLILRSGHPYFGLYANDFVSDEKLKINVWYHLVWRYIIEIGEQAIFLNGKKVGSSLGHPPFSGTGEIHLGSALSRGASLRGYIDDLYFWDRPLGAEEISHLALNEEVSVKSDKKSGANLLWIYFIALPLGIILLSTAGVLYYMKRKKAGRISNNYTVNEPDRNKILLFGELKVIDRDGTDISELFTPKVKELFLFILLNSVKNNVGVEISLINETLWPGVSIQNMTNNRAVTLNKLRKILEKLEGMEIVAQNGLLFAKVGKSMYCDFAEAYFLCHKQRNLSKTELDHFFHIVKTGRLLKGISWPWLDEVMGYTGNQVIDNLLKLAAIYKKENRYDEINSIARRILDYDDLNEEAVYLQILTLQKTGNTHQSKFLFNSFSSRYSEIMGEPFSISFEKFIQLYSEQI